jgi:hypothetical protein
MQDDSVMVALRSIVVALVIGYSSGLAEARQGLDPGRFFCANLKIGCVKKKSRPKARKPAKTAAAAKPVTKPRAEAVKPAPVKPRAKPESSKTEPEAKQVERQPKQVERQPKQVEPQPKQVEPQPKQVEPQPKQVEPETKQAMVTPVKPVAKPPELAEPSPQAGPPSAENGTACRADLERLGADIEMVPQLVADQACQISNPVAIKSLKIRGGAVALPGKPVLNCAFARQFVTWLGDVAAPVVAGHEDSALAAVSTGPGFQCRGRNGDASAKMSEHASGNAIDIDAIVLADKKRIDIVSVADAANPAYRLLMALRISACGYFTTVLGPGSNAAHATHYHFDLGIHGKSSNYRICE